MIIQVGVETSVPVLIVDTATNKGVEGLTLVPMASANGDEFVELGTPVEVGDGWYMLKILQSETGTAIVVVNGGEGNSVWRDIIEVWEVEPTIPVRYRPIRAGLST